MADQAKSSTPTGELFQRPEQPAAGAGAVLLFFVAAVLLFGGLFLLSLAFSVESGAIFYFAGGIISATIAFVLAFGIAPHRD